MVKKLRCYGKSPFQVIVLHGGPGAPGSAGPVAKGLASHWNVIEPFQTADSIDGQVNEHVEIINTYTDPPIGVVGHSWGGWLGFIIAARHPELVKNLILVSSGPFEQKYVNQLQETRSNRLTDKEKGKIQLYSSRLESDKKHVKKSAFKRLGEIYSRVDSFDEIEESKTGIDYMPDTCRKVWLEATKIRKSGNLLKLGEKITCPVTAIHGNYDPHPFQGVSKPLSSVLNKFQFVLLENCGHRPWFEKNAREEFFQSLRDHLA